jgi:hypothetical protein
MSQGTILIIGRGGKTGARVRLGRILYFFLATNCASRVDMRVLSISTSIQ